jgi:hypothetical protein
VVGRQQIVYEIGVFYYFEGYLLAIRQLVRGKMVTKSSVFTILKVTKLGFDCILTPQKIAEAFILLQTCLK